MFSGPEFNSSPVYMRILYCFTPFLNKSRSLSFEDGPARVILRLIRLISRIASNLFSLHFYFLFLFPFPGTIPTRNCRAKLQWFYNSISQLSGSQRGGKEKGGKGRDEKLVSVSDKLGGFT